MFTVKSHVTISDSPENDFSVESGKGTHHPVIMKRFFQPVKKDGSFPSKKPSLSSADPLHSTVGDLVSVEGTHPVEAGERERREPCKFLTWNANSLLLRMKKDLPEFSNLVQTLDPDAIAIQVLKIGPDNEPEEEEVHGSNGRIEV
ncbi:hypothetical protein IEQ34_003259 [Dendrobium chrysotoxum]|uniref:Uncharacterized protein n=1 Tax=Dendrobium chrysotoxum TaxID=161865 RepID=A0AAV7HGM0_DENCH|nr:hypothetical protein IEQ34_003259 [Dendrobium chrysotoxum]